jgi:predicted ATPase/DNA-binding SARP family transcriptional activator
MDTGAWQIEMLGGMRARRGSSVVERFQTQKTAAVLAMLAYQPNRRRSREELIDLLWPDAEPEAGRHRLSQALVWLRSQLEPPDVPKNSVLLADRHSVGLQPGTVVTDVTQFEAAIQSAPKDPDTSESIQALEQAVGLYQGDLLPGFYEDWVIHERQRLQNTFIAALRILVSGHERAQQYGQALAHTRRALEIDPLDEELHRDLMRLLAAAGQPAAALRHYRELERTLSREMGEAPADATRVLIERIRRSEPPSIAPPRVPHARPALPQPLTRFFGRHCEIGLAETRLLSEGVRLLTLTGIGGGGKTRLAIEIARRLSSHFQEAVWFVPLTDLSDAALIPDAVADTMRLPRSAAAPTERIVTALAVRPSLLVLDNLEHLADDVTPMIGELLARVPSLVVLATSRHRLGLTGEWEIPVPPLQTPVGSLTQNGPPASLEQLMTLDSVRLFMDRAQAVRPGFRLNDRNAEAVAQLCERLDGIPLAIELCAAWAQTLTPVQMLTQLTHRFDLLVSRRADITPRHRSLRAALEYSSSRLTPDLLWAFSHLSVFRGGWTLEAAQKIALGDADPSAWDILTELRERSLVIANEVGDEMRYRMLETLREFAGEHLDPAETCEARRAHAEYFLSLAVAAEVPLSGPEQALWLAHLEADYDNLRAALAWSLEEDGAAQTGLRLGGALALFWDVRGYLDEGQDWLDRLLALPREDTGAHSTAVRAKALTARGYLARNQGASAEIDAAMREALTLWRSLGDSQGMATALMTLATLAYSREDCDEARAFLEEGLALARGIGDQSLVARALLNLGNIALEQGELAQAWNLYTESLGLFQSSGARIRTAYALNNMGLVARYQDDLATAETLLKDALQICREFSDRTGVAEALLNLGTVYRLTGRHEASRAALGEAVTVATEAGEKRLLAWCVKELGHITCAEGE